MRTRVKICGITRPEDGVAAARLGADAIGLVFYAKSPRAVTLAQARAVVDALPPFVTTVALFVDPQPAEVEAVLSAVAPDLLQFHGNESPEFCAQFGRHWIKAIHMRDGTDLAAVMQQYRQGRGVLLDTYRPGVPGGTGEAFDWDAIPASLASQITLAGGLTPANIAEAIKKVRPYAVDVSGGVEAGKGIKDAAKMAAFFKNASCS
jgi:phosphoribosylanthranilate isomerase